MPDIKHNAGLQPARWLKWTVRSTWQSQVLQLRLHLHGNQVLKRYIISRAYRSGSTKVSIVILIDRSDTVMLFAQSEFIATFRYIDRLLRNTVLYRKCSGSDRQAAKTGRNA